MPIYIEPEYSSVQLSEYRILVEQRYENSLSSLKTFLFQPSRKYTKTCSHDHIALMSFFKSTIMLVTIFEQYNKVSSFLRAAFAVSSLERYFEQANLCSGCSASVNVFWIY